MEVLVEGRREFQSTSLTVDWFSFLTLAEEVTWGELGYLSVPPILHLYDGVIRPMSPALMSLNEAIVLGLTHNYYFLFPSHPSSILQPFI